MENQRARQEEQAQKEKEHNSAHYPQFLLATLFCLYHPNSIRVQRLNEFQRTFQFRILVLKIRWMNDAVIPSSGYAMPKEELEQLREELRRQRELQEAKNSVINIRRVAAFF